MSLNYPSILNFPSTIPSTSFLFVPILNFTTPILVVPSNIQ